MTEISSGSMQNPHPWIDVSSYPVVVFTCPEIGDRPDGAAVATALYRAWYEWLVAHPQPFVVIIDTSSMKSFPAAKARAALAEGEKSTTPLENQYNKGTRCDKYTGAWDDDGRLLVVPTALSESFFWELR